MSNEKQIEQYIGELVALLASGHALEHAYRPALERLMNSFNDVRAVNDPKRSAHGNPDMVFLKASNNDIILGYAEAKDVNVGLDKVEKTNQMHRYSGYDNLFLTNYLEFRFYKNGDKHQTIEIGVLKNGIIELFPQNYSMLADELQNFLESQPESIKSGKRLALIMGAKARRIRDRINRKFTDEDIKADELNKIYNAMRDLLVHDLTREKFADMYAQTLVYGLFVARYGDKTKETFSREEARDLVPASNPFLRDFFEHIAGARFDKDLAQIVDELCEAFRVSDVHLLVQKHLRLFEVENDKDPIIHFYEDFLKEYDPAERKKMGAYYTPIPVVKFMIRQVDEILKTEFGLQKGLADTAKIDHTVVDTGGKKYKHQIHRVQVLDPAVGTATFLNEIIKYVHKGFAGQEGRWPAYAETELIPRLHGFELMMAPYTIAHLKLGMILQDSGVKNLGKRLGVYLTNTLEEGDTKQADLFAAFGLAETISHEAAEAAKIKYERPIMVVIGNPPYSGVSSNETDYANSLIAKYKVEPGGKQKLQERKHWLNDDYVKFIAFAEDMVTKNGEGIVAMITNNGYLDNPTFRGMRWHLASTFDKIYVLDLHGNAKKNETTTDGSKDANVFDIMQGVGIILAVKTGNKKSKNKLAEVYHADIYGTRQYKFDMLAKMPPWQQLQLDTKSLYFVPKDMSGHAEYEAGVSVNEVFVVSSSGVLTARDNVVIDIDRDALLARMRKIADTSISDDVTREWLFPGKRAGKYLAGDSRGWQLSKAREIIGKQNIEENIKKINYRPFDSRYVYYVPEMIDWGRFSLMSNYYKDNIGLLFSRMTKGRDFAHVQVTDKISEVIYLSPLTGTNAFNAPLYIYHEDGSRTPNFDQAKLKELLSELGPYCYTNERSDRSEPPEEFWIIAIDVFDYIYGVLHSPSYRKKYKEFLKIDFPRIPKPQSAQEFAHYFVLGRELRNLHLMQHPCLDTFDTAYPIVGTDEVVKLIYENGKVFINDTQYFGNVPKVAWDYYIGGYQPAQKWLKDRRSRKLSNDEIEHYQKIIKILAETDKLMKQLDDLSGL